MTPLEQIAPAFVEMAHSIVWASVATVDANGRPRTRILHPIWEWDGTQLQGWIATAPQSPKARDLAGTPYVSLTYWDPTHDTCTADGTATWRDDLADRQALWDTFSSTPPPLGYDPRIIPMWQDGPTSEQFAVLRLSPYRLRVMRGTVMTNGEGAPLTWSA